MSSDELPLDVIALLCAHVSGLDDLEMLLHLRRAAAESWASSTLAAVLGMPEPKVRASLETLCDGALLVVDDAAAEVRFYYRPATDALDATVSSLARIYDERPADVIRTLHDHAFERVRLAGLRPVSRAC